MASFTWLNLTDLHMGLEEQDWLWPRVRASFLEDLARLLGQVGPIDAVLFTGDLTQRGQQAEFERFDEFLEDLWSKLANEHVVLLAVPGNHDLQRPRDNAAVRGLTRYWTQDIELQQQFWREPQSDYRGAVDAAFREYTRWWKLCTRRPRVGLRDGLLPGDFAVTIEDNGMRIGVVGLNTSFLQLTGSPFEGKLSIHPLQFQAVTSGDGPKWIKEHDVCVLMTHHPPTWLDPRARAQFFEEIHSHEHFAVHLYGHMHEPSSIRTTIDGVDERRSWQGRSLCGLEFFEKEAQQIERSHGYAIGRIEISDEHAELLFWPRQLVRRGGQREFDWDTSQHRIQPQNHTPPAKCKVHRLMSARRAPEPPPPRVIVRPVLPPLPLVDAAEIEPARFIGRQGLLSDFNKAVESIITLSHSTISSVEPVQLIWYHGFGGLGKSLFLRRAYIEARDRFRELRIGLIDWYMPQWRQPAADRLYAPQDLFDAIAYRIGQLYGVETLDSYWDATVQVKKVAMHRAALEAKFEAALMVSESIHRQGEDEETAAESLSRADVGLRQCDVERSEIIRLLRAAGADRTRRDYAVRLQHILENIESRQRLFQHWVENCYPPNDASDYVVCPNERMADALRGCIREAAKHQPLLLMIDTHERLGEEYDWWLRQVLAEVFDGQLPLLVIVSGRFAPNRDWLNYVPEARRRVVPFDESAHFTPQEIRQALDRVRPAQDHTDALVDSISRFTHGLPLAVGMLLDDYRRREDAFDDWEMPDIDETQPPEDVTREITKLVTDRVLLQVDRNEASMTSDFAAIIAMVVCTRRRRELLRELWYDVGYGERIAQLRRNYSFVYGDDLHPTVREHVRQHFRDDPPALLGPIVNSLLRIHDQLRIESRPSEADFLPDLLESLNLCSWRDREDALPAFARALAVCLAFEVGTEDLILVQEIPVRTERGRRLREQLAEWSSVPPWFDPWLVREHNLAWLPSPSPSAASAIERGAIAVLQGLVASESGQHAAAIKYLDAALEALGDETPRRGQVAKAYLTASAAMRDEHHIRHAFQQAGALRQSLVSGWLEKLYHIHDQDVSSKLSPDERERFVSLMQLLIDCASEIHGRVTALGDDTQAELFDPSPLLLVQAHFLHRHLGRNELAKVAYARISLEAIHTLSPILHSEYAIYLVEAHRYDAAAVILDKVVQTSPDDLSWFFRQLSKEALVMPQFAASARHFIEVTRSSTSSSVQTLMLAAVVSARLGFPEADEFARRTVAEVRHDDALALNSVAWAFYMASLRLDDAAALAARGCEVAPDNLNVLQSLAAIRVRMDHWSEAALDITRWASHLTPEHLAESWQDFILMFRDAIQHGRAASLAAALEAGGQPQLWQDIIDAVVLAADNPVSSAAPRQRVARFVEQLQSTTLNCDFP